MGCTRRQALRVGGAACASGLWLSAPASAQDRAAEVVPFETSRTVHAIDDLGWDPSGDSPIDTSLSDVFSDGDVTVLVPPGEYRCDQSHEDIAANVALVGTGSSHQDARFTIPAGQSRRILNINGARNFCLANLSFDQKDDWVTCIGNVITGPDGIFLGRVELLGNRGPEGRKALSVRATDPDGVAVVEEFYRRGGQHFEDYDAGGDELCFHAGGDHRGTLILRDFHIENAGENGIYASRCPGDVRVERGVFINCQNTAIRVCGEGSYIDGARILIDTSLDRFRERNRHVEFDHGGMIDQTRAIWWESGFMGKTGGEIRNCQIVCRETPRSGGLIRINGSAGAVAIRDTNIYCAVDDVPLIWAQRPGSGNMIDGPGDLEREDGDHNWPTVIERVSITGDSSGPRAAIEIVGRSGSVVRDSCISVSGDRDGVSFYNSPASVVEETAISVPGDQIGEASQLGETVGITADASCPMPSLDVPGGTSKEEAAAVIGSTTATWTTLGMLGLLLAGTLAAIGLVVVGFALAVLLVAIVVKRRRG